MSEIKTDIEPLVAGDKLTVDEFLRRWETMPELKKAELIGGVVYMPSPLSVGHGRSDLGLGYLLMHYALQTPGTDAASNATWRMLQDAPQPDIVLRVVEAHGGQSKAEYYFHGAPELAAEVCHSSTACDLHQKKDLYRQAGVREYLTLLLREQEVRWFRLEGGEYRLLAPAADGKLRSLEFPGLWLDARALLAGRLQDALETLNLGLASPEHADFAATLAKRKG